MALVKSKSGYTMLAAIITAIVGLIFYIYTSTNGYLAGRSLKMLPIVCTVIAIALTVVLALYGTKLNYVLADLLVLSATVLLIVSFALFTMDRVSLVADVYFIPVNYPQEEARSLNLSIVGMVFYLISIVAMILSSFSSRLTKE